MSSRPLIVALTVLSLMWIVWIVTALMIANSMNLPDSSAPVTPMANAAYDTSGFAWQPTTVCVLNRVPKRINRA